MTSSTAPSDQQYTNALIHEQSPYLLQHAHNPVHWLPWGEEAFTLAKQRDVPIILSVGYSTCHWCHVMERESFENKEIADIMNASFVSVKVDKEERPDVDKLYMTYVQATQGGGGWPMTCFLTPDLDPFFAGTYFPPTDAYGRPGFKTVLNRIAEVWSQRKEEIKTSSAEAMLQLADALAPSSHSDTGSAGADLTVPTAQYATYITNCADALQRRFDSKLGGFGGAPKFPRPSELLLVFTAYLHHLKASSGSSGSISTDARAMLHMATFTLERMAAGGMRDQLGGGFHRYSVDEYWHVPHFEIMLYDQPQLVHAYLTAFSITRDVYKYASPVRGVLDYLLRGLRHPEGGFYAAEDADSVDPKDGKKKEGEFYVWTEEDIDAVLAPTSAQAAAAFKRYYGVQKQGNATRSPRSDPHGEFQGKNILYVAQPTTAAAPDTTIDRTRNSSQGGEDLSVGQVEEVLAMCREKLFSARKAQKPRPHRDEKVVVAWNGMAIGALAVAGRTLASEDPPIDQPCFPVEGRDPKEYIKAGRQAAEFIKARCYNGETKQLCRSFLSSPSPIPGFSDDYAHMISGLIDLYMVTGDVGDLKWAYELQEKMDELFWDDVGGGYFQAMKDGDSSGSGSGVRIRLKDDYDGAEVASSSVAVANLWKLGSLAGTEQGAVFKQRAARCAAGFDDHLKELPIGMPQMCTSLGLLQTRHARQVVIAGRRSAADTEALLTAVYSVYAPDKVVIHIDLSDTELMEWWRGHNPEAVGIVEGSGWGEEGDATATAFICQNFTCRKPTTDPGEVEKVLGEVGGKGRVVVVEERGLKLK